MSKSGHIRFRKLHRPPPLDVNDLKNDMLPGSGTEWVEREDGTWVHEKGTIEFTKKTGLTATVHRSMRGERTTLVLSGASLGTAAAWIETQT